MIPQNNIKVESHIDGLRRLRKTFEGTYEGISMLEKKRLEKPKTKVHLEYCIRNKEYGQAYKILIISYTKVSFHVIQLKGIHEHSRAP